MTTKRKKTAFFLLVTMMTSVLFLMTGCFFDKETTALYIYMCGSTLETNGAAATTNIREMLETELPEDMTVVIETGGSKKWRDYDIPGDKLSRYVIENQELVLKETLEQANMGESDTLSDFLRYCEEEYPADRTGVIFWDHGNGSVGGVCYDQNYKMDSLTLSEMADALENVDVHYDMVGFDACLMATLDMGVLLSDYADYMLASQEIEPAGGWDYSALLKHFGNDKELPDAGRGICDSYMEKCKGNDNASIATLAFVDLKRMRSTEQCFAGVAENMSELTNEKFGNFEIITASDNATKFGANSDLEGHSNLMDLHNFSESLQNEAGDKLCQSLDSTVVYKVSGESRENAGGLSVFYPTHYNEEQLQEYLSICQIQEYKEYLMNLYTDIPKKTIEFADRGSEAEDGSFRIRLTEESKKYVKSVDFYLIEFGEPPKDNPYKQTIYGLGVDNDIYKDWNTMDFHSNFRGIWVGLDGQLLSYSVVESNDKQVVFSAPVIVNDRMTNLRFCFIFDDAYDNGGYYQVIGLWDGLDADGLASKEVTPLKKGDKVTILARQIDQGDYLTSLTQMASVTIGEDGGIISEVPLGEKYYQYVYAVRDIFGKVYYSNTIVLKMEYSKKELEEHPLPDGEYAASIDVISEYSDSDIDVYGDIMED